ncbi:MAG: tetratricopeptide repeat protein [Flammeovirgaceae bacterium]
MRTKLLFILLLITQLTAQGQDLPSLDSVKMLLTNPAIELECTFGINNMYNNKFDVAESQFQWLRRKYPKHPLPNFLLGLSNWWRIMPNLDNKKYDIIFLAYMDSSIYYAKGMYKIDNSNIEAAFFLSAAYAFKARLYSERKMWRKAAVAGKRSLKYLEICRDKDYLSPELLFGDGIYNYYSVWIPENYPSLKPILLFFRKGDKQKGIEQLEEVRKEAFYTRVEAELFLMRIYALEENQNTKALYISQHLHKTFPNNPYFHRFYARMLYSTGRYRSLKPVAEEILTRIDSGWVGYEEISGRYAAYYLAYLNDSRNGDQAKAVNYYKRTIEFAEKIESHSSGYYLLSLSALARKAEKAKRYDEALEYYKKVLKHGNKKRSYYKKAKTFKKNYKKYKKGKAP